MNRFPIERMMTSEALEAFLSQWAGERRALAPVSLSASISPAMIQQLQQAGIFDSWGQVTEPYVSLLSSLAKTEFCASLCVSLPDMSKCMTLYGFKDEKPQSGLSFVSVIEHDSDQVTVQAPLTGVDLSAELDLVLEAGEGINIQLDTRLTSEEIQVLAAMLDLQRAANQLLGASDSGKRDTPADWVWDESIILKALQRDDDADAALWLISFLIEPMLPDQEWTLNGVQDIVSNLVFKEEIVKLENNDYALTETWKEILKHLATPEKFFWFSILRARDEEDELPPAEDEIMGICSQGINLLFVATANNNFGSAVLPGEAVIDIIKDEFPAPPQPIQVCSQCNQPLSANARFCNHCGTPVRDSPSASTWELEVPGMATPFRLGGPITIGRSESCDLQLPDPQVSRQHARIEFHQDGFRIVDLESRNGVFVNEQRISQPVSLKSGDQIGIGDTRLRITASPAGQGATIMDMDR